MEDSDLFPDHKALLHFLSIVRSSIVQPFLQPMLHVRQKLPQGLGITGQFVGHEHTRKVTSVLWHTSDHISSTTSEPFRRSA
jgi:hypothetical protein